MVIDGIRHKEILEALRKIVFPTHIFLIFIDVNIEIRTTRLSKRTRSSANIQDVERYEQHSTEKQIFSTLRHCADLIVIGNKSVEILAKEVIDWLNDKKEMIDL